MVKDDNHPYRWSAILNGHDPEAMASCPASVIPMYLANQQRQQTSAPPSSRGDKGQRRGRLGLAEQTPQLSRTAKTSRDATQRGHGDLSLNRGSNRCMILREGKVEIGNSPDIACGSAELRSAPASDMICIPWVRHASRKPTAPPACRGYALRRKVCWRGTHKPSGQPSQWGPRTRRVPEAV